MIKEIIQKEVFQQAVGQRERSEEYIEELLKRIEYLEIPLLGDSEVLPAQQSDASTMSLRNLPDALNPPHSGFLQTMCNIRASRPRFS